MTPTPRFNVRLIIASGMVIDIPCSSEQEARQLRNDALGQGFRVRITVAPFAPVVIRPLSTDN